MKVMLVNEYPLGIPGSGGVEIHVRGLADILTAAGHQALVVTGQMRGQPACRADGCCRVPGLGGPPWRKRMVAHRRAQRRALDEVRGLVASERPDLIHIHNLYEARSLHALRHMGLPTVKSIHDCRPFCTKPRPNVATRLIGRSEEFCDITMGMRCWSRCYARAADKPADLLEAWSFFPNNLRALREVLACDRILVSSHYLWNLAIASGASAAKLDMLYYFTDIETAAVAAPVTAGARPVLLFAGRLTPEKGALKLLDAIARLTSPGFDVRIAGDGPQQMAVAARASELAPHCRITLLGFLDRAQVIRECAACSALVFPAIGSEGCPQIGIEAMQHGKPVIACDVGGVPEWLVDGVTGLLVTRNDIDALARAIARLMGDAPLRERLGAQARDHVQRKFRQDNYVRGLLEVYGRAMEQGARS